MVKPAEKQRVTPIFKKSVMERSLLIDNPLRFLDTIF